MKDKDENIPHFFLGGISTKREKKGKMTRNKFTVLLNIIAVH